MTEEQMASEQATLDMALLRIKDAMIRIDEVLLDKHAVGADYENVLWRVRDAVRDSLRECRKIGFGPQ